MNCFLILLATVAVALPTQRGRYIIKLKPQASASSLFSYVEQANRGQLIPPAKVLHQFKPDFFNGVTGEFTPSFLAQLERDRAQDLEYVHPVKKVWAVSQQRNPPSWGLGRVSSTTKLSNYTLYQYPSGAGKGVNVFVIDTGLQVHKDFDNRAKMLKSFIENEEAVDLNGHGTHCAGTVASKSYGVAKEVNVWGIKVLDKEGSGTDVDVVKGIELVTTEHFQPGKTIISLSLGGEKSQALDDGIKAAYERGVVVIVAAGNEGMDACDQSPSGAAGAFSVGATDVEDEVAEFSNKGKCVKVLAPGVDIKSLWIGSDGATDTLSGTSMACPHVARIAAIYMSSANNLKPDQVYNAIVNCASKISSGSNEDNLSLAFNNYDHYCRF